MVSTKLAADCRSLSRARCSYSNSVSELSFSASDIFIACLIDAYFVLEKPQFDAVRCTVYYVICAGFHTSVACSGHKIMTTPLASAQTGVSCTESRNNIIVLLFTIIVYRYWHGNGLSKGYLMVFGSRGANCSSLLY